MNTDPTVRELAALRLLETEGECNEGMMSDLLWPLIRRPRIVVNGLLAQGLVTRTWLGDEAGYELHLTDAGRAALACGAT